MPKGVFPRHPKPLADRFWSKVIKRGLNKCWEWNGAVHSGKWNYGRIFIGGTKTINAHAASWMIHFGPIPQGLFVLHTCDNPPCCNPEHLFLGTTRDNSLDAQRKGRLRLPYPYRVGREISLAKLDEEKVREIRSAYDPPKICYRVLAQKYGVDRSTIADVVRHLTWRHVDAP